MAHVFYNSRKGVLRGCGIGDYWAPAATLTGMRVVEARAAAHKRRTRGVDLVSAYAITDELGSTLPRDQDAGCPSDHGPGREHEISSSAKPGKRILRVKYGIPRVEADVVTWFGSGLLLLAWHRVPEKPALFACLQVEDQGSAARRAIRHRDRLREAFAKALAR